MRKKGSMSFVHITDTLQTAKTKELFILIINLNKVLFVVKLSINWGNFCALISEKLKFYIPFINKNVQLQSHQRFVIVGNFHHTPF